MKKLLIGLALLITQFVNAQDSCVVLNLPYQSPVTNSICVGKTSQVGVHIVTDSLFTWKHQGFVGVQHFIKDSLFPVIQSIYKKDSISIYLQSVFSYINTDPYYGLTSSTAYLMAFGNDMQANPPPADLYCLLSGSPYNFGGVAYVGVLGSQPQYRVSFCNLYGNEFGLPDDTVYTWNVEVISHELGHNLGSQHTQWCGWLNGPIDTCWTPEGNCYVGPHISRKGTIMSYCHLTDSGIYLPNGFGVQPANAIKQHICNQSATLLHPDTVINPIVCQIDSFKTDNITNNSARINWLGSCNKYKVAFKLNTDTVWAILPSTTNNYVNLTGLLSNRLYKWKVKCFCNNQWLTFYPTQSFKTLK